MNRRIKNSSTNHTQRSLNKLIPILFENEQIIVFDKPSGLLVIPTPKKETTTLVSEVNKQIQDRQETYKLHPCHRLDRETSGVIMFAKGKRNQQLMMDLFRNNGIEKTYVAFVQGHLKKKKGEIRGFISDLDQLKYRKKSQGKLAISQYKVVKQKKEFSVLEIKPITGRTNQIRIQFSQMGHPLLGDRKYSVVRNFPVRFKRTALHAASLQWRDPLSRKTLTIRSTLPKDMEVFCAVN